MVQIVPDVSFDATTREVQVSADIEALQGLTGELRCAFLLTETNIVDWQKNGSESTPSDLSYLGGTIPDYVHKHVLRTSLGGTFGLMW